LCGEAGDSSASRAPGAPTGTARTRRRSPLEVRFQRFRATLARTYIPSRALGQATCKMTVTDASHPRRHDAPHRGPSRLSGEELLRRHRRHPDPRLRERVIEQYMPLAKRLAARYHRGQEPLDDLMQVAYVGLVKAVDRYDPSVGTRFSSFAIPTISGELRRHFRDTAWTLHVPRGVQEAALSVTRATSVLSHQLGRPPTISELAQATGLEIEEVAEALQARSAQDVTSLDQPRAGGEEGDTTVAELIGGEDGRIDLVDHRVTVAPLIRALPAREREILFMRFAEDMTQTEIAERVGCSQMQVSRLLRRAISRLSQVSDEPQAAPGALARIAARRPGGG
jgi:RNA polymerase sigma-B factor